MNIKLNTKTDEELDELAVLVQKKAEKQRFVYSGGMQIDPRDYHPTQDSESGKAQCWDLMIKGSMRVNCFRSGDSSAAVHAKTRAYDENPQRAIVMAYILANQNDR